MNCKEESNLLKMRYSEDSLYLELLMESTDIFHSFPTTSHCKCATHIPQLPICQKRLCETPNIAILGTFHYEVPLSKWRFFPSANFGECGDLLFLWSVRNAAKS